MRNGSCVRISIGCVSMMLLCSVVAAADSTGSIEKVKPLEIGSKPSIAKPADTLSPKSKGADKGPESQAVATPPASSTSTQSPASVLSGPTPSLTPGTTSTGATAATPNQTPSGRMINDVRVGINPSVATPSQTSTKPTNPPASSADPLEAQVRGLLQEKLGREGEVLLRVSPDTPAGKTDPSLSVGGKTLATKKDGSNASGTKLPEKNVMDYPTSAAQSKAQTEPTSAAAELKPKANMSSNPAYVWDWVGTRGPQAWGRLDPSYALCSSGELQSPPRISEDSVIESMSPSSPRLSWVPQTFAWSRFGPLWTANLAGGSKTEFRGESYALESIQFRFPGEPFVGNEEPLGSIHFIHRLGSRFLVLAIPIEVAAGAKRNAAISILLRRFPFDESDTVSWDGLTLDWSDVINANLRTAIVFSGSMSHPPCTESVIWFVSRRPLVLPEDQLLELTKLLGSGRRPAQALNRRPVLGIGVLN